MYQIILNDDNRITGWYSPPINSDGIIIDVLPDGDYHDYLYVNEQYVYEPLPKADEEPIPTAPRNITVGEYIAVNGTLYKATANIPDGGNIITGQNAYETTVEAQLYELAQQKGE